MDNIILCTSSDSEDDCYGGLVQKLQKLKNTYMEDKVENVLLLKPNTDIDDIIKQNASVLENHQDDSIEVGRVARKRKIKQKEDTNDGNISVDGETSQVRARDRGRRASSRNMTTETEELLSVPRRRTSKRQNLTHIKEFTPRNSASRKAISRRGVPTSSRRGASTSRRGASTSRRGASTSRRGASTSRRGVSTSRRGASTSGTRTTPKRVRSRRTRRLRRACSRGSSSENSAISSRGSSNERNFISRRSNSENEAIPVGDIDYPDQSKGQPLFSNPSTTETQTVVVIDDDIVDPLSDNEEMSVKVFWQNCDIFKFQIRRYQKLTQLFDFFSKRESLNYDKLLMTYNGRILKPSNTPDSIDYNIAKFIDGGVVKNSVTDMSMNSPIKSNCDLITIKFQSQIRKHPLEIKVFLDEKFSVALIKCAEELDVAIERLKFYFDGDIINPLSTPREFEFEGGECIDVKFID